MAGKYIILISLQMKPTNSNIEQIFETLPKYLKTNIRTARNESLAELQERISANLQKIVFYTSVDMVGSGIYSTNPLKNIAYVWSKF